MATAPECVKVPRPQPAKRVKRSGHGQDLWGCLQATGCMRDESRGIASLPRLVGFSPTRYPDSLPRGVTVAQMTLDHFVMVQIHAGQFLIALWRYGRSLAFPP